MIILPSKHLMLLPAAPDYAKALRSVPLRGKVTYKDKLYAVADYNLRNSKVLARCGVEHQGPIHHFYNWPGRYTPYDHQRHTADFFTQHDRCYCFNGLRTGKTLSAIWAADFLMELGEIRRVMVITTMTTLDRTWATSLFTTLPGRDYVVLHADYDKRHKLLAEPHDYYVINHDGVKLITEQYERSETVFRRLTETMRQRDDIDLYIVDEGAIFRNKRTDLWKALNTVCGPRTEKKLWWLTGNPTPTGPTDAWAQARVVTPNTVPSAFTRFRRMVMHPAGPFDWEANDGWEHIVYQVLQPSIRYKRSDCTDLPPPSVDTMTVKMSKKQQTAYDQMMKHLAVEHAEGKITAANEGIKSLKLLQIACGLLYGPEQSLDMDAGPKYKALLELIEDSDNKAIVLLPFKDMVDLLAKKLQKSGYSSAVVRGGVSRSRRAAIFHEFQEGFLNVICAHPKTMAHGIDLTEGYTIIWWGPTSYELYEQANARIDGPNQKHDQQIWHLTCSPIEAKAYKRLEKHESMSGILLELLGEKK